MKGLIFNCKPDEVTHYKIFTCVHNMQTAANRKIMPGAPFTQNLINDYIDLILKNEKRYMKKLRKSDDIEDKKELENLIACKQIMDLQFWKNYTHLQALFNDGFFAGSHY